MRVDALQLIEGGFGAEVSFEVGSHAWDIGKACGRGPAVTLTFVPGGYLHLTIIGRESESWAKIIDMRNKDIVWNVSSRNRSR